MSIECEDKIDIFDDELEEMSAESLKSLLAIVSCCGEECSGCGEEIKLLKKMIAEKV
jgi:hypothetical protein